jgi:hypothetical protein
MMRPCGGMIDNIEKCLTIVRRCPRLTALYLYPVSCLVVLWDGQPCAVAPSVLRLNYYDEREVPWKRQAR